MKKNCGCKVPCGCKDVALTTPASPPCTQGTADCPNPEQCSEVFDARCVTWQGDPIIDLGIKPGDRLSEVIEKLALAATNSGCVLANATCHSVLNLASIAKSTTTITLGWTAALGATSYVIEYKLPAAMSYTSSAPIAVPATSGTIGGLLPNTEYYIRVRTTCASSTCYSLIISVKTNPA
jgi:hypothetical protein